MLSSRAVIECSLLCCCRPWMLGNNDIIFHQNGTPNCDKPYFQIRTVSCMEIRAFFFSAIGLFRLSRIGLFFFNIHALVKTPSKTTRSAKGNRLLFRIVSLLLAQSANFLPQSSQLLTAPSPPKNLSCCTSSAS